MKIKNIVCYIIIFCFVLCLFGCSKKKSEDTAETRERVEAETASFLISGISKEGNNYYAISKENSMNLESIPSLYFVGANYQYKSRTLGEVDDKYIFQKTFDYFTLDIYSIRSSEKLKTINANEILEKNCPGSQFFVSHFFTRPYKGNPCIGIYIQKRPEIEGEISIEKLKDALLEMDTSRKIIYIDVETEEVYAEQFYLEGEMSTPMLRKMNVLSNGYNRESPRSPIRDLWEINGIKGGASGVLKYFEGTCIIGLPITSLPENNKSLYSMFPKLKEQVKEVMEKEWKEGDEIPYIDIVLTNNPTPEEVMHLILNDGKEISFSGAILDKLYSVDNEPHEIQSFEDYYQYRKPYESELDASEIGPIFTAD